MPGQTIGLALQAGYIGTVSESLPSIIEARALNAAANTINFGAPVFLNNDNSLFDIGTSSLAAGAPAFATFLGFAVSIVKQGLTQSGSASGQYAPSQMVDVMSRGIMTLKCGYTTGIKAGGPVYLRTVFNATFSGEPIGTLRAAADSTNTIQLTNARWRTGQLDANNVTEIHLLTPNN